MSVGRYRITKSHEKKKANSDCLTIPNESQFSLKILNHEQYAIAIRKISIWHMIWYLKTLKSKQTINKVEYLFPKISIKMTFTKLVSILDKNSPLTTLELQSMKISKFSWRDYPHSPPPLQLAPSVFVWFLGAGFSLSAGSRLKNQLIGGLSHPLFGGIG